MYSFYDYSLVGQVFGGICILFTLLMLLSFALRSIGLLRATQVASAVAAIVCFSLMLIARNHLPFISFVAQRHLVGSRVAIVNARKPGELPTVQDKGTSIRDLLVWCYIFQFLFRLLTIGVANSYASKWRKEAVEIRSSRSDTQTPVFEHDGIRYPKQSSSYHLPPVRPS